MSTRVLLVGGPREGEEFLIPEEQVPAISRYGWDLAIPVDVVGITDTRSLTRRTFAHYGYGRTIPPTTLTPSPTLVLIYEAPVTRPENPDATITTYRPTGIPGLPVGQGTPPPAGFPVLEAGVQGRQLQGDVVAALLPGPRAVRVVRPEAGQGQLSPVVPLDSPEADIPE